MIFPIALVDRWPDEPYKDQYSTIEEALAANTKDALLAWHEIEILKKSFRRSDDRPSRIHDKNLNTVLRTRTEQLNILLKYSDFPAMVVASFKNARLLDKNKFWIEDRAGNIDRPVLIRGISSASIGDHIRARGEDYYFIETGYLGNYPCKNNDGGRKLYHRIVKNAMQHSDIWDVPDDRWNDLVKFNPDLRYNGWKKNPGSKILVVAPSEKPCKYYGITQADWIESTVCMLKTQTDREIIVRHKQPRWARSQSTIYEALHDDIWATVTYNSIAALESIHAGVPAFALAPTAAEKLCLNDLNQIENPYYPDEDLVYKLLCSIAYGQFHMHELISGKAWQMVIENETRPKISC